MTAALLLLALVGQHSAPIDFPKMLGSADCCFLARNLDTGLEISYNHERTMQAFSPCSTFKVPNTVFALEAGVADLDTKFPWDDVQRERVSLNKDHTLETAFQVSAFNIYQEIARRIGEDRMREYVGRLKYGNQDMSGGLDQFWLGSSLKITARQQVDLMQGLLNLKWPFEEQHQTTVLNLMAQEVEDGYLYGGKTGSGRNPAIGWWVGYAKSPERGRWVFAVNRGGEGALGSNLIAPTRTILGELNILPKEGAQP